MPTESADDFTALLSRAQAAADAGRRAEALALCRHLASQGSDDPEVLNDLGNTLGSLGCPDEAVPVLQRSANRCPDEPVIAYNLGNALNRAGRRPEAGTQFRRALALWPEFVEAHNNLGLLLFDRGAFAEAACCFSSAARLRPDMAEAHGNLGLALLEAGQADAAITALRRALHLQPDDPALLGRLGEALRRIGALSDALPLVRRAAALAGNDPLRLGAWAATLAALPADQAPRLADDFFACLKVRDIDHQALARHGLALLHSRLDLPALLAEVEEGGAWPAGLADPLLLRLMRLAILPDADIETLLTRCRARLLGNLDAPGPNSHPPAFVLDFAAALAAQCHLNGHVYAVAAGEADAVATLAERIAAALAEGLALHPLPVLVLAAYRPLASAGRPDALRRWGESNDDPAIRDLLADWLEAPARRAALAAAIPQLTPIADRVSRAVQAQYEENPYPAWRGLNRPAPRPVPAMLRSLFPDAVLEPAPPEHPEILVAGCGTGRHAVETALRHPGARVLAVDLSRQALAYGRDRAEALGIHTLSFAQADLLALAETERRFDLVEAVGVLHHLRDPEEGWRAVTRLARHGGLLRLGLYSAAARRPIAAAREVLAGHGLAATPDGIRQGRQALLALPPDHPAAPVTQATDFHSLSGCRDLLFHVQEHVTTLPDIARLLNENDLDFLGFELPSRALAQAYDAAFPADPGRRNLANWTALENRYPDAFAGMYLFWARRH
ncbi:MAG: tetratricopeptide repeat protein [Alphaproteobacteria bacterium]|jgi:Flp pilus assembly protein TadD/SAM-dependent methyltransferase|nr:tetratricopeptide repeat protein [Alphaproteobacteria bacterium]